MGDVIKLPGGGGRSKTPPVDRGLSVVLGLLESERAFASVRANKLTGVVEGVETVTIAAARLFIDQCFDGKTPRRDIVMDALEILAERRAYDPLTEHVEGLPRWDGTHRVMTWLCDYAGAEDDDYNRSVGEKFLISLVARALRPGCKVDSMLVLKGSQGARKGTLFEVLGGEFYKSNLNVAGLHGKESRQEIRGSWLIEFPELNTIRKGDMDSTKAFLSERIDKYRPSYGRHVITVPRRAVFCGSINNARPFLQDTESQRRLWIVRVQTADIDRLEADRDQLLAEARDLFLAGEPWWFNDVEDHAHRLRLEEEQALCRIDDPWVAKVEEFIAGRDEVTVAEVLTQGLLMPAKEMGKASEMRVATILGDLGFEKGRQLMRNGKRSVYWNRIVGELSF